MRFKAITSAYLWRWTKSPRNCEARGYKPWLKSLGCDQCGIKQAMDERAICCHPSRLTTFPPPPILLHTRFQTIFFTCERGWVMQPLWKARSRLFLFAGQLFGNFRHDLWAQLGHHAVY